MTIDIQVAKAAARGHWHNIATQVLKIPDDYLTTKQGPCPKCKCGTDRWKVFKDFAETGGAMCNQCGKSADGFSLGQWWLGCSLNEVIEKVCNFLGVEDPAKSKKRKKDPARVLANEPSNSEPIDAPKPTKDLPITLRPWNDKHFAMCFESKKPITMEAVKLAGGTVAKHYSDTVMAFPCIGRDGKPSGWAMYNITGGPIKWRPNENEPYQDLKIKLIGCQGGGWIGRINPNRPDDPIFKVEGVSDMLAILSANPEASVVTNANGAGQDPLAKDRQWMLEIFRGRIVYTIHDRDDAGFEGATWIGTDVKKRPGWAVAISLVAKESKNVDLPFEMNSKKPNEKDVRDFFNDRLDRLDTLEEAYEELLKICHDSPAIVPPEGYQVSSLEVDSKLNEPTQAVNERYHVDDPKRLALSNIDCYRTEFGGEIAFYRGEWYKYRNGRYKRENDDDFRSKITQSIQRDFELVNEIEVAKHSEWKKSPDYDPAKDKGAPKVRKVTGALVNNVMGQLQGICRIPASVNMPCRLTDRAKPSYLSMKNGILDLEKVLDDADLSECLIPHTRDWFSMVRLDYDFTLEKQCSKWLSYLDDVLESDESRINILQEFFGYCLTPGNLYQSWLALEGVGQDGKTVALNVLSYMLGPENVSHVTLGNFGGQFSLESTIGKAVNISSDTDEIDNLSEGVIKQYVGGDVVSIDRKHKPPLSILPTAKLIAAWNNRPRIRDSSDGMWRRMILVPFKKKIEKDKIIREMLDDEFWKDELPAILNWSIVGLDRLRKQNGFSESEECKKALYEYRSESNPLVAFREDCLEVGENLSCKTSYAYETYREWCGRNGHSAKASIGFGKALKRIIPELKNEKTGSDRHYFGFTIRSDVFS